MAKLSGAKKTKIQLMSRTRFKIEVSGIVQGVGFRPFVYGLAQKNSLSGYVNNTSLGVIIEVEGEAENIREFLSALKNNPPHLAQIDDVSSSEIPCLNSTEFKIIKSRPGENIQTLISPDTAICPDCQSELFESSNRRFRYPFINCTNCGPRFTIIKDIPYDRPKTTMADFVMCKECQDEYENPGDRRFHAQPNACPVCGPQVWLEKCGSNEILFKEDEALQSVSKFLSEGKIIAIKGLGGFHLMVDAGNSDAVKRLRQRKNREEKALALMMKDINVVKDICHVNETEEKLLKSYQSPIVLLKKKNTDTIADEVAPGNPFLGVMLPYTPLHQIVLHDFSKLAGPDKTAALVATSGNRSEEPIAISNDDARIRLTNIADYILLNNRDILVRSDDSVVQVYGKKTMFFRRSRGYAPTPVNIHNEGPVILGTGAELKNVICVAKGKQAFLSQHIGDLENLLAHNFFTETVSHIQRITSTKAEIIAHDLHPGYLSTQWALQQKDVTRFPVQHHHAHMAAVMAEYQLEEPVIGIIMDGTGFGYDKKIWGGEFLVGDYIEIQRFAHLEYMPLPGGDAAIKHPWRTAVAYLHRVFGDRIPELPFMQGLNSQPIIEMVEKDINCVETSSCGRLFDAVAAMSGGKKTVHYEAQAAIEMMNIASTNPGKSRPYNVSFENKKRKISVANIIRAVVKDIEESFNFSEIAGRFHATLIHLFTEAAIAAARETGINKIILSGGVFQNIVLLQGLDTELTKQGFTVFIPQKTPVNDGGIALGQIAITRKLIEKQQENVAYSDQ